jgi:hypothetical protein
MEQKDNELRERLLARLPQPENMAAYREETASFLARHERALFWEKWTARTFTLLGAVLYLFAISPSIPLREQNLLGANEKIFLSVVAGLLFFIGIIYELGYQVSRSKVDLLKEVKQVQLQVVEIQARLEKSEDHRS